MSGTGSVYRERDRWIAQLQTGPRGAVIKRRRTLATRAEAVAALAELRDEAAPAARTDLTVSAYLERWVTNVRNLRPNTLRAYRNAVTYQLSPTIGHLQLRALSPLDVEGMLTALAPTMAPKSLRNVLAVLHRALTHAVRAELVPRNVAAREYVDPVRVPAGEPRAFTHDEIRRLRPEIAGDRLEVAVLLPLGTGLRQGEVLGLAWEDLDLEGGRVNVRRELVRRDGAYHRDELKTDGSRRAVPLSPSLVAALADHRRRVREAGFVPVATGPVFTNLAGGPVNGTWLTHHLQKALRRAGIPDGDFQTLRRTFASRLAEAGVSDLEIARLLGHSRTHTARKHYIAAGTVPAAVTETVERMVG